jgi:2-polyprenyl-3-methyl-5-hydroxy-6-metoxy-1,4-benzoquinol methylase
MAGEWWEGFFDADYQRLWPHLVAPGDEDAEAVWRALALAPGVRVLDAPCGYGRVSRPLAERGASVLGVDRSQAQLDEAERRRGGLGQERLRYLRHDLRQGLSEDGFDAALCLFTSLGYGTEGEDVAVLRTLAAAVRPGGAVAVETSHRDLVVARLARGTSGGTASFSRRMPDGTLLLEEPRLDAVTGRVETTWYWAGPAGSGKKSASIRTYTVTELVRLLEAAGLRLREARSLRGGGPFEARGPEMGGPVLLVTDRP